VLYTCVPFQPLKEPVQLVRCDSDVQILPKEKRRMSRRKQITTRQIVSSRAIGFIKRKIYSHSNPSIPHCFYLLLLPIPSRTQSRQHTARSTQTHVGIRGSRGFAALNLVSIGSKPPKKEPLPDRVTQPTTGASILVHSTYGSTFVPCTAKHNFSQVYTPSPPRTPRKFKPFPPLGSSSRTFSGPTSYYVWQGENFARNKHTSSSTTEGALTSTVLWIWIPLHPSIHPSVPSTFGIFNPIRGSKIM
jgi:hypothetical protein